MGLNRSSRVPCDDLDTRIDPDGIWSYHGSPIGRKELVRLFSVMLTLEEVFGWVKTCAGLSKTRFRGRHRVEASFTLALAAYNLVRLPRLLAGMPP